MKRYLGKLLSACCLLMAAAPVFLVAGAALLPGEPLLWAAWPLAAVVLGSAIAMLPPRWRARGAILAMAAYVFAAALWAYDWKTGLLVVPGFVLLLLVMRGASRPAFEEWPIVWMFAGIVAHVVCMLVARGSGPPLAAFLPYQRWLLLAYVPVFLLYSNQTSLLAGASARDGGKPPWRIRAGNRHIAIGLSAVVLVIANLGLIRDAFYTVAGWIGRMVWTVISWILSLLALEEVAGGPGGEPDMSFMEAMPPSEPSLFWVILEKVAMVLAFAAMAVLAILALRQIIKLLRRLAAFLAARLRDAAQQLGEDVQEKTESILDWEEMRDAAAKRLSRIRRRFAQQPRWQDMENRARVRWAYGKWAAKQKGLMPAQTAREALHACTDGEAMADIYEKARYSEDDVTEADAAFMRGAAGREE